MNKTDALTASANMITTANALHDYINSLPDDPVTPPIVLPPVTVPPVQPSNPPAGTLGVVKVLNVIPNDDSTKIEIADYPGALDYMAFTVDAAGQPSHDGKCFGGNGPGASREVGIPGTWGHGVPDFPPCCGEINGLNPTGVNRVRIVAYDGLLPYGYIDGNTKPGVCPDPATCGGVTNWDCPAAMRFNGHGPPIARPNIIAQSDIIEITCVPFKMLGDGQYLDTFRDGTFKPLMQVTPDPRLRLDLGAAQFENGDYRFIKYHAAMTDKTLVFQMHHHLMTVNEDPSKVAYSTVAMTRMNHPVVGLNTGKVVHFCGEWDAVFGGRRWMDFVLHKRSAIVVRSDWATHYLNLTSDEDCIVVSVQFNGVLFAQFDHRSTNMGKQESGIDGVTGYKLAGATGLAPPTPADQILGESFRRAPWALGTAQVGEVMADGTKVSSWCNGRDWNIDNRHLMRVFLSTDRVMFFEQGVMKGSWPLPMPLDPTEWADMQCTVLEHIYDTNEEHAEVQPPPIGNYVETMTHWRDNTPYYDARHLDNTGLETVSAFPQVVNGRMA